MKWANFYSLLILAFATATASFAAESGAASDAETWVRLAREKKLSERTEWRRLLHYRSGWFGSDESPAIGNLFILAPDGATHADHELEATLRGFFREMSPAELAVKTPSKPGVADLQPPQCQFPARLMWLQKELGFSSSALPHQDCSRYQHFAKTVAAQSVTLVFSSYYLNNPSSAFGHTFLRLNKTKGVREGRGAELLDYGINYAAVMDTSNAVLYAFKGITGLFAGTFTSVPYYLKIREYNDHDSRDLWEYDLRFTPDQTAFLVAHLWELGSTYFRYFYLTKNCSYEVLALLDVMDPSLHLIKDLASIVIPSDSVQLLNRVPGLVTAIHYRPSIRSEFDRRISLMTAAEKDAVSKIIDSRESGKIEETLTAFSKSGATEASQISVLDAATDYINMKYAGALMLAQTGEKTEATAWKRAILAHRSELSGSSPEIPIPPPWRKMPQAGHGVRRLSLDGGHHERFGAFTTLQLRFALHDLADPSAGYPEYAQLEMGSIRLRYNYTGSKLWLDDINLFRVISLNPLARFDKKLSWGVGLQTKRFYDGICKDTCFGLSFDVSGGFAVNPISDLPLTFYLFGTGEANAAATLPEAHFRPGFGPTAGMRFHPTESVGVSVQGGYRYRLLAGPHDAAWVEGIGRWEFISSLAVEARGTYYRRDDRTGDHEGALGLSYYY